MTRLPNAQLIEDGESQIVIFPEEVQFAATYVHFRRLGAGVLVEPVGQLRPHLSKPVKIPKVQKRKRR